MRVTRKHVDGLDVVAIDFPLQHLAFRIVEVALLDEAVTLDHDELLELGVVPMLPLGDAHRVDGICRLVGGEADDALHARIDGRIQRVVRADHIGLHSLHREELARGHLLQGRSMEHIIDALHGVLQRALVAHVTDVELDLARHLRHTRLEVVPHVVLLLLVAREDADLSDIGAKEAVQDGIAETAGAARDKQRIVFKY